VDEPVSVAGSGPRVPSARRPGVPAVPAGDGCAPGWVGAWQDAAQPGPGDPDLAGATVRMLAGPQVTGSQVRVRLSNAYGTTPLVVGTVSAAGQRRRHDR